MCQRFQKSCGLVAKYGRLKFSASSKPSILAMPRAASV